MELERDESKDRLRITLTLSELGQLAMDQDVLAKDTQHIGYISTLIKHSRPRRINPNHVVHLDQGHLAVLLSNLHLPAIIHGIRGPNEEVISRNTETIVELAQTQPTKAS